METIRLFGFSAGAKAQRLSAYRGLTDRPSTSVGHSCVDLTDVDGEPAVDLQKRCFAPGSLAVIQAAEGFALGAQVADQLALLGADERYACGVDSFEEAGAL